MLSEGRRYKFLHRPASPQSVSLSERKMKYVFLLGVLAIFVISTENPKKEVEANAETIENLKEQNQEAIFKVNALQYVIDKLKNAGSVAIPETPKS